MKKDKKTKKGKVRRKRQRREIELKKKEGKSQRRMKEKRKKWISKELCWEIMQNKLEAKCLKFVSPPKIEICIGL